LAAYLGDRGLPADGPDGARAPARVPPRDVATGKALAGALPMRRDAPLARYSTADRAFQVGSHPERPPMSASTIGRILDGDALKPWQHRSWITPRDPQFAAKAGRVRDLDAGWWDGEPLDPADCVLSADEKTNIQARVRCHTTTPTRPGQPMRVEHEYDRSGALAYLAASSTTAAATGARRPLTDSGSATPTFILAHLPIHAPWLNQIEICFSIVQRKVLAPRAQRLPHSTLGAVERRLLAFEARYNDTAVPFHWRFTRQHLEAQLAALPDLPPPRLDAPTPPPAPPHPLAA